MYTYGWYSPVRLSRLSLEMTFYILHFSVIMSAAALLYIPRGFIVLLVESLVCFILLYSMQNMCCQKLLLNY